MKIRTIIIKAPILSTGHSWKHHLFRDMNPRRGSFAGKSKQTNVDSRSLFPIHQHPKKRNQYRVSEKGVERERYLIDARSRRTRRHWGRDEEEKESCRAFKYERAPARECRKFSSLGSKSAFWKF